jgi:phosphatidylglycerophosphate synthase
LASGLAAALMISISPSGSFLAGFLVLLTWFFDRADGQLARRQDTSTPFGAWLDANVDEVVDVAWHVGIAIALASMTFSAWPWMALSAFLAGKYLFMYSLAAEEWQTPATIPLNSVASTDDGVVVKKPRTRKRKQTIKIAQPESEPVTIPIPQWLTTRALYHLPANADVRVHALAFAAIFGLGGVELLLFAAYYNVRWIVRYVLVARRLYGGVA